MNQLDRRWRPVASSSSRSSPKCHGLPTGSMAQRSVSTKADLRLTADIPPSYSVSAPVWPARSVWLEVFGVAAAPAGVLPGGSDRAARPDALASERLSHGPGFRFLVLARTPNGKKNQRNTACSRSARRSRRMIPLLLRDCRLGSYQPGISPRALGMRTYPARRPVRNAVNKSRRRIPPEAVMGCAPPCSDEAIERAFRMALFGVLHGAPQWYAWRRAVAPPGQTVYEPLIFAAPGGARRPCILPFPGKLLVNPVVRISSSNRSTTLLQPGPAKASRMTTRFPLVPVESQRAQWSTVHMACRCGISRRSGRHLSGRTKPHHW